MQIGIGGLPGAGKTTLFNALAHQHAQVGGYAGNEPNLAVVKVPDERLDKLSALFQPRKHTPAELRFVDVAGVAKGGAAQDSSASVLANLRTVDVLLQVVGAFRDGATPARDYEDFSLELQLADLGQIERRVERLDRELRLGGKGTPQERALKERELAVLMKLQPVLESGQPIRGVELGEDERRAIANFGFLSQKPTLVVINTADASSLDPAELAALQQAASAPKTAVIALPAKLEM
jgi:ribosome-binding ATPase YchF (GTP1/OBG family)